MEYCRPVAETDGVPLRSIAQTPGFDPVRTWGPGPILLVKPASEDLRSRAETPALKLGMDLASTSHITDVDKNLTDFFHADTRLVPIRKTDRNQARDRVLIGRARTCDVRISEPTVSKVHAAILFPPSWPMLEEPGGWRLRDCHSRNGTWVPVPSGRAQAAPASGPGLALFPGTQILFGAVEAVFVDADYMRDALEIAVKQWKERDLEQARRTSPDTDLIPRLEEDLS